MSDSPAPAQVTPPAPPARSTVRLSSLDAFRGLVMFLMLAEVLQLAYVAANASEATSVWKFLAFNQSHVEWVGFSLHDLIQPGFSLLVGAALPFSLLNRQSRGQSLGWMALHALWRSVLLIALGIFLRSLGRQQTLWEFTDTLCQIGLGYFFLFLIGIAPRPTAWIAFVAILVGYWLLFALHPLPADDADLKGVFVKNEWKEKHWQPGFAGHWNKNVNPASEFDAWFLNQFPREQPFIASSGGYQTLNFIPTLATMILGLLAGRVLASERSHRYKFLWLVIAGVIGVALGWSLGYFGICPVVKRIWTPSWVLFSGGWCLLILAGFYGIVDGLGYKAWVFPLVVIGMNSIVAYALSYRLRGDIGIALERHLGKDIFLAFGPAYRPLVLGSCVLVLIWLILFWLYRKKLFVRI